MKYIYILIIAGVAIAAIGCQSPQSNLSANSNASANTASNAKWDAYVDQFLNDYFAANPTFGVTSGKHEYDGKFPDWSDAGLKKEIARLKAEREKASAFKDADLDERQRFERDYLIAQIDKDLFWQETADYPHINPNYYSDALDPDVYVSRPYAPLEQRIKSYTTYAKNVPAALEQIKGVLKSPMAKNHIKIARQTIGGLADFYEKDVPKIFESVKDEASQKDFTEANAAAAKAVKEFDAWLGEQEKTASDNFALGADKFKLMLKQTEGVDIDLAQLEEIGKKDLQRNLDAMKTECDKYAPGMSLIECSNKASAHKAEGKDVVEAATAQLADLRKFIQEKEIVTIPGTEECKVAQAPPYKAWNFAYINIPGPYETNLPSVYYVSPPDPKWDKKKQEEYVPGKGSLLFTSVHEGYPGHFVQFLHANRAKSKFGQVFVGYAFAEGWAHYTEEMMYDAGLGAGDPEMHIGQLQEALLRNVRFLSAIGMHTKGMTVDESRKMFIEQGLRSEGEAEQQSARGTFDPAYLNYTMGKLMIKKLREDWTASHGGRSAWKQFHDAFLAYGGPPIPLVRKAMMGANDKGTLF
ncbi:MAG TPA: DUF885 domain-containing protein [Pyrinomonadaceae bacterium]|nr:DUF885 domain-containing protein [Pyrinomonadaceae bacterium]